MLGFIKKKRLAQGINMVKKNYLPSGLITLKSTHTIRNIFEEKLLQLIAAF